MLRWSRLRQWMPPCAAVAQGLSEHAHRFCLSEHATVGAIMCCEGTGSIYLDMHMDSICLMCTCLTWPSHHVDMSDNAHPSGSICLRMLAWIRTFLDASRPRALGCGTHRFSPPEELVLPREFPRAPNQLVAMLLAPCAWFIGRPDLFDSYRFGAIRLPMLHT
jgi:hypothetical protein